MLLYVPLGKEPARAATRLVSRPRFVALTLFLAVAAGASRVGAQSAPIAATLRWSTYLGGAIPAAPRPAPPSEPTNSLDQARDVAADSQGNIYVAGGARTTDFPHTIGPAHAGDMDAFIAKFSPSGALLWSRFVGGPNYERIYGIEVRPGDDNEIVICGRGGPSMPTKACAGCNGQLLDATFNGTLSAGHEYGQQDGFVGKLDAAGNVSWLSYFGDNSDDLIRDCDIDAQGYVYVGHLGLATASPSLGTAGAFRATPYGGAGNDTLIAKIDPAGRSVVWATYVGGTRLDGVPSLRVRSDGTVYAAMHTESTDFPMVNAVDTAIGGARDFAIVHIAADGRTLLFSSYLGGNGSTEWTGTHDIGIDSAGNLYLCAETDSTNFPGTAGFFQPSNGGGTDHIFAKIKVTAPTAILAATYVGGPGTDGELQGCSVDAAGNVLAASLSSGSGTSYPTTGNAIQTDNEGGIDATVVQLAADFRSLRYATYLGGNGDDEGRAAVVFNGGFVLVGSTRSADFTVANAYQPTLAQVASGDPDAFVSAFVVTTGASSPTSTITRTATRTPTQSLTPTRTATRSATATAVSVPSATPTLVPSRTATATFTRTGTATPSPPPSPTASRSPSRTNTATPTRTRTATFTAVVPPTPSPTRTVTTTPTRTGTPSFTASRSPPPSATGTLPHTGTPTGTGTPSFTPTATASASGSIGGATPSETATPVATASNSPSATVTEASQPSGTPTELPSATATEASQPSATPTESPSATATGAPQPSATPTESPSATATEAPQPSATLTDSPIAPATDTPAPSMTPEPTGQPTLDPTATVSATPTDPVTPTPSATLEPSPVATHTPTPTAIAGDVNGDGALDEDDLVQLIAALFAPDPPPAADLDGDGFVSSADVLTLVQLLSP